MISGRAGSITQAFNTTSSMGRLTPNMLLSFAQFEREVNRNRPLRHGGAFGLTWILA